MRVGSGKDDCGQRLVTDDAVMFLNDCREASAEQKIALQRLLNEGHLAWDKRRGVCSESLYAPKDGQLVKLSILDEHVILGAFKEIDAKGRVVLYCLLDEDGSLRYSLHETVGYAVNLQNCLSEPVAVEAFRCSTPERACMERTAEGTRTAGNTCQTR